MKAQSGIAGALVLLWGSTSTAQGVDAFGAYGYSARSQQSPQNMAVELRLGRYTPRVDDEFEGSGDAPYLRHFGDDMRWSIGFEADWQLLRIPKVGSLGPGFGLSYTKLTGAAFFDDDPTEPSEQTTKHQILPMMLVGVLRVDILARETPVPLVPYGKLGLGWALWWMEDGLGLLRDENGVEAQGTSYGPAWALGLMLLLDFLDARSARDLDSTVGVNHSYLFAEWFNSDLDGFNSGLMQVGVNTWVAGLAIEL